jgi:hypothetical protein
MDQNEKVANDKVAKLENEIKVLKNEVQAVLLDLRESYLNMGNPFNPVANPTAVQPIVIQEQIQTREPPQAREQTSTRGPKAGQTKETSKSEPVSSEKDSSEKYSAEDEAEDISEPEPAPREMKRAQPMPLELSSQPVKTSSKANKQSDLDLVVVAGLIGWVEDTAGKLGKERAEAMLDISEAMGYLTADLKPILIKLIALAPQPAAEISARTRDYIESLIKINSLFGQDNREETALLLLSLVSGDKNHG